MSQQAKDELDKAIDRAFRENQEKLPPEDRCAARSRDMCFHKHDGWACTKVKEHTGDHVAHGSMGYILARWPNS
jgi:hypothetical protein